MRKYLLLLLAFIPAALSADDISPDKAKELAEHFLSSHQKHTRSSDISLELVWNGTGPYLETKASVQAAPFYVFNNTSGNGYVIIAGDDTYMPVLGYSFDSNISREEMPDNFISWMNFIIREQQHAKAHGLSSSSKVRSRWMSMEKGQTSAGRVVKYHQTASWDQSEPFWTECPKYRKKQTYTGCVITAVSTVMKFHAWPDHGTGTTEAYSTASKKIKVKARTLGQKYDWENMPHRYFSEEGSKLYTQYQAEQVARLMADVGSILKADYGTEDMGGTGAYSEDIPAALVKYMGYDKSIYCASRDHYPYEQWLSMLKEELATCPIVYGGVSQEGGHSFVLDGYTDNDYFHVNWGWGGMSDGYFLLSALEPDQQGAGGSASGFNTMQDAILNMRPDHGGEAVEQMMMVPVEDPDNDIHYHGLVATVDDFRQGKTFKLTAGALINSGFSAFDSDVQVCLVSADGNVKEVLYTERFEGQNRFETGYVYGLDDIDITISEKIVTGDKIKLYYKSNRMKDFSPVLGAPGDNFTYELPVAGEVSRGQEPEFAHEIALNYIRSERKILVSLPEGVSFRIEGKDGTDHSDICSVGKFTVTLDMLRLKSGSYRLVFSKGSQKKVVTLEY